MAHKKFYDSAIYFYQLVPTKKYIKLNPGISSYAPSLIGQSKSKARHRDSRKNFEQKTLSLEYLEDHNRNYYVP